MHSAPSRDAVVVVTGGSYGRGREVVRMLARRGYAIVVVYLEDQKRAEATVEEAFAADGTAVAVRADVTDDLDVERVFDEAVAVFGGVYVVVHTARQSASVLYQHAARRDITVIVLASRAGDVGAEHGVADLLSFLDRGRHRPPRGGRP